jgi:hypothetical protein
VAEKLRPKKNSISTAPGGWIAQVETRLHGCRKVVAVPANRVEDTSERENESQENSCEQKTQHWNSEAENPTRRGFADYKPSEHRTATADWSRVLIAYL